MVVMCGTNFQIRDEPHPRFAPIWPTVRELRLARIFQPIPLYGRIEAILLVMARERQRFAGIASAGRCNRR